MSKKDKLTALICAGIVVGVSVVPVPSAEPNVSTEVCTETEVITEPLESTVTVVTSEPITVSDPETEARPEYYCDWLDMELTEYEFNLLCTTTFCEAGNQDFNTQVLVCLTILNRVNSDLYSDTIRGAIYEKNAYSVTSWSNFESRGWTEQVEDAVRYALSTNEHPRDLFYFRTKHYHTFGKPYVKSDDVYFSTQD